MTSGGEAGGRSGAGRALEAALALALLGVAGWLAATRWQKAKIDWNLGTLRSDPGSEEALRAVLDAGPAAMPILAHDARAADPDTRFVAVMVLSDMPGDEATALLVEATRDPDGITAANALAGLARRPGAAAAAGLAGALGDARLGVRVQARRALEARVGIGWWAFGRAAAAPVAAGGGG